MKILREYRTRVYEDGTIEMKEVTVKNDFIEILDECSEKIKQSILVILQMKVLKEQKKDENVDYAKLYNDSINIVADNLGVVRPTIHDKLERQMNKSAKEMKDITEDFFTKKNQYLKQVMLTSIKDTKKEKADTIAIEELFKRLSI